MSDNQRKVDIPLDDEYWFRADWTRELPRQCWDPGRKLLKSIRMYQRLKKKKGYWPLMLQKICVLRHRFWSVVSGADIPLNSRIGGGLLIPHPNGIVIHPDAEIGVNCLIFQQVTIGGGTPKIGTHVDIGAGAKVLGNITIGDSVLIGANSVVIHSVESGMVVAGVPAKVIRKT